MGRGGKRQPKKKKGSDAASNNNGAGGESLVWVDPARIRFQHSKIRPYFSGCGRNVVSTLEQIRNHELRPSDLPPIQVLVGPNDDDDGLPWYFSLNNRRLWVLKRCREEGLLQDSDNLIQVRVRQPKSEAERNRYTIEKCALEAKFMSEKKPTTTTTTTTRESQQAGVNPHSEEVSSGRTENDQKDSDTEEQDDADDDDSYHPHNPFDVLL